MYVIPVCRAGMVWWNSNHQRAAWHVRIPGFVAKAVTREGCLHVCIDFACSQRSLERAVWHVMHTCPEQV
jgi:hypothetical protein